MTEVQFLGELIYWTVQDQGSKV